MKKFALNTAVVLATAVLFLSFGCSSEEREPTVGTDGSTEFATIEDFLSAETTPNRQQVVFIGLDGATWGIIDPMIEAGELPTFERLKTEGAFGTLRSVDCYFSPPAWVSLFTGYLPERHGVYTFGKWMRDTREFQSVSALDNHKPAVWDIASNAGKRVAVTNMAVTHPVHPINGIMVSGLMTPFGYRKKPLSGNVNMQRLNGTFDSEMDAQSKSNPLYCEIPLGFSTMALCMYDLQQGRVRYETVAYKVFGPDESWDKSDGEIDGTFKLGQYSPWFQIVYQREGDEAPTRATIAFKLTHTGATTGRGQFVTSPLLRTPSDEDLVLTYPAGLGQEIEDEFWLLLDRDELRQRVHPEVCRGFGGFCVVVLRL